MDRRPSPLRRPTAFRTAGALAFVLASGACSPADRRADCAPVGGGGCGTGERCVVDAQGSPRCVDAPPTAESGAACTTPDACPAGHGCVAVDARATCLPFCNPAAPSGIATCSEWSAGARCLGAIDGHPEIGVCVPPCDDPADVDASCAPAGGASACHVPAGLDFAVCSGVAAGAGRGAPCGPDARCEKDDVCLPRGEGARCRAAAPCEVGTFVDRLPGAPRVAACSPCRLIAGPAAGDAPEIRYAVCAAVLDGAGATALCASEGGTLVGAGVAGVDALVRSALEVVDAPLVGDGRCWDDEGETTCASGRPLCRVDTAD
jgi:hypothetical protein